MTRFDHSFLRESAGLAQTIAPQRRRIQHVSSKVRLVLFALLAALVVLAGQREAFAVLGGFETADGYAGPFPVDVWSYDAGQTGAPFLPAQYNTGRWKELFGSGNAGGDAQYVSQHGFGGGGANMPPYALAVRSISPSTDGSYDMTVQYDLGADDLGVAATTPLTSASISFDICPGVTIVSGSGADTVFNDVPAFTLSMGGTDGSPGATVGFTDSDPSNSNRTQLINYDGATYNTTAVAWTGRFDHLDLNIDFNTQTYDLYWTPDFNLGTTEFDAGNVPTLIASGASLTSAISTLEHFYFRAHTDPSTGGGAQAGLEKSYLDNFQFRVKAVVPEPATAQLVLIGLGLCAAAARRRRS